VDNDKNMPQTKMPILKWYNQNPNITTVEKLIVTLTAASKYSKLQTLPTFQTMYQPGHVFLRCDIPVVRLQYIMRAEM